MKKTIGAVTAAITVMLVINSPELIAQDTFEEWKRNQQEQFETFRNEQDAAFMKMLEASWEFVEDYDTQHLLEEVKPDQIPQRDRDETATETDRQVEDRIDEEQYVPVEIDLSSIGKTMVTEDSPAKEDHKKDPVDVDSKGLVKMELLFYKTPVAIHMDSAFETFQRKENIDDDLISSYWENAATSDYEPVLQSLKSQRSSLRLNDWSFAKLIFQTGMAVHQNDRQLADLFSWFMLTQSGYAVRVGYNEDRIHLLFAFENPVFSASFFTLNGTRFYAVAFDGVYPESGPMYTYQDDFPGADRKISTEITDLPKLTSDMVERDLTFEYNDSTYRISVEVNQNVIAFYEYYPQTNLEVYFNAPTTLATSRQVLYQLGSIIDGKSETEAANMLLRFSQTAFGYKIDPQNFGREKPLFPEETLFYDYSDCEDRSIMYHFLVSNLLGLDVVGLRYPGHIATAVKFNSNVPGDFIRHNGATYTISDPTYIYADIGMEMPDFEDITPEVISLQP